jgi:RNA polymerase II subunit A small phosphatase-like protein
MSRPLLILDLDETLIYATEQASEISPHFAVGPYSVYKRPGVDEFLAALPQWYEVAIWTSSSAVYAGEVVRQLIPSSLELKFLWTRSRCVRRYDYETQEEYWVKDLKKVRRLGYALERILVVDDSPEKLQRNYGNYIRIYPFVGNTGDKELANLLPFLQHLSTLDNVRHVEKRGWRSFGNVT